MSFVMSFRNYALMKEHVLCVPVANVVDPVALRAKGRSPVLVVLG